MKNTVLLTIMAMFCAWPVYGAYPTSGTTQNAYCQVPPYLASNVKPNINLVLDFSGSMQFPAYLDCSAFSSYDASKVANCGTYSNPAAKFLYDTARNYYGNYKSNVYYKYNTAGYFEENSVCTDTDRKGKISTSCLSGNLLNWAVTTRTDVLRKILTGGRVKAATTDVVESEGARYIFTDTALHCKFTVTAAATTTRLLKIENESASATCAIGTGSGYNMDVKTTTPTTDITGIIQSMFPSMVDLELSVYNGSVANSVAFRTAKNKPVADYLTAINSELAYSGTPTGEALRESKYYYQQSSLMTATGKATVLGKANFLMDPYYETGNLPAPCRKSYVLLISDGAWNGSVDPVNPAHDMRKNDMRTDSAMQQGVPPAKQTVRTYAVYAFGDEITGRQAMITTALFGGYDDDDANGWPYPFTSLPNSLTVTYPRTNCDPSGTWDPKCAEWDPEKTGLPNNFYEGSDGAALQAAIAKAILDIQTKTSSGTAASVMGNSDSSGATLLQALYFPEKSFEASTKATWLGEIQALWYYVDPLLKYINIREDSLSDNKLKLANDRIASFDFDGSVTRVNLYDDSNGDGGADTPSTAAGNVSVDVVNALWRAGKSLWSRPASDRTIYVNDPTVATTQGSRIVFGASNLAKLKPYLDVASVDADATNVINYTLGDYITGYRDKRVTIGGTTNVWKLGDIIGSSPRMLTPVSVNTYNLAEGGYRDKSYDMFVNSAGYKERNLAIAGSNDGILHAFKTGKNTVGSSGFLSELKNGDNSTPVTDLGKELWGFVPKNVLPYLKHLGNPNYSHLYYINSTPYFIDASIADVDKQCSNDPLKGCSVDTDCGTYGSPAPTCSTITPVCTGSNCPKIDKSWRTVMIGSMGLGGATRDSSVSCTDCVKTPASSSGIGYSSYFALDVTDPANPLLLWEFSNPRLGFSTVGPAVMRIKDSSDTSTLSNKNGNWYVVLASGPTGPIDSVTNQMKGLSDQPLSLFVLDLKTGTPVRTFSSDTAALIAGVGHTTVANTIMPDFAFGGSLYNSSIDTDKWDTGRPGAYSDDGLYLGYTTKDTTAGSPSLGKYAKGGILRLMTGDDPTPANWKVSTVIKNIGPVTSSVAKLQNKYNKELWLFFGTGRYFFKSGSILDEDYTGQQEAIYGIKDPCYVSTNADQTKVNDLSDTACTAPVTLPVVDQTTTINTVDSSKGGWKINLALEGGGFKAQRITSNPVATSLGTLFFVAMKPTADICSYGGTTSVWTINYNNGDAPSAALKGVVLLQKTTGATETIGLGRPSSGGAIGNSGNREGSQGAGLTGQDSPPVLSNAEHTPSKKILHIQER